MRDRLEYYKFKAESLRMIAVMFGTPLGIKFTNFIVGDLSFSLGILLSIFDLKNIGSFLLFYVGLQVFFRSQDIMEKRDLVLLQRGQ